MARTSAKSRRSAGAYAATNMPVCSVSPAITGTATEGQTLSCSTGTWSNTPDTYSRQWNRSGVAISGATSSTYELTADDVGATITCTVKATNLGVSAVAISAATAAIAEA